MPEPVPVKRTRQFSFTNFSLTQPNKPQPGDKLDDEVDRTNAVLNDVIDFVRQAISDEGTIRFEAIEEGTYIIATGPVGPPGPAFQPDAVGNTAGRATYDAQPEGFAYLDTQASPPLLYFRQTAAPGVWSTPVVFNNGPVGPQGPAGPAGTPGANGATIFPLAAGTPGPSLGQNGDFAINTTNGNLFAKSGGVWALQGNLRGPQGIPGPTGATGPTGPVGPQGAPGTTIPAATVAEAIAGTLTDRYVSPAGLKGALDSILKYRNVQVFLTSGTFNPPAGVTEGYAVLFGGGGGGGGRTVYGNGATPPSADGFAGGYGAVVIGDVTLTSGMPVVVGAGGAGGPNGPGFSTFGTPGGAGGNTSFGGLVAGGGQGGARGAGGGVGANGAGSGPFDRAGVITVRDILAFFLRVAASTADSFAPMQEQITEVVSGPFAAAPYSLSGLYRPGSRGVGSVDTLAGSANGGKGGVGGAAFIFY